MCLSLGDVHTRRGEEEEEDEKEEGKEEEEEGEEEDKKVEKGNEVKIRLSSDSFLWTFSSSCIALAWNMLAFYIAGYRVTTVATCGCCIQPSHMGGFKQHIFNVPKL